MNKVFHVFESAIHPFVCEGIIKRGLTLPPQDASIGFDQDRNDNSYRVSTVRWFPFRQNKDIVDTIISFVNEANRDFFGFDIFNCTYDLQFTEYHSETNGKYDWHHDVWWYNPRPHDRKLSVVIQLSSPDSYTGGNFEFRMPETDHNELNKFKMQGSILVFPSFFVHRVTPLLTGTRYSLVSWVEGPKFR